MLDWMSVQTPDHQRAEYRERLALLATSPRATRVTAPRATRDLRLQLELLALETPARRQERRRPR